MDMNAFRQAFTAAVRTGAAPKRNFGSGLAQKSAKTHAQMLRGSPIDIKSTLDGLHQSIRNAPSAAAMGEALDKYVAWAAQLALSFPQSSALSAAGLAAPFIPGGAVLSAAVNGLAAVRSS